MRGGERLGRSGSDSPGPFRISPATGSASIHRIEEKPACQSDIDRWRRKHGQQAERVHYVPWQCPRGRSLAGTSECGRSSIVRLVAVVSLMQGGNGTREAGDWQDGKWTINPFGLLHLPVLCVIINECEDSLHSRVF